MITRRERSIWRSDAWLRRLHSDCPFCFYLFVVGLAILAAAGVLTVLEYFPPEMRP